MHTIKNLFLLGGIIASLSLQAQQVIENFDNVSTLPSNGWVFDNRSNMPSTTTWDQGNGDAFPAHSGAVDSYIVNDTSTGVDLVCNWLIMPSIGFIDQLSFYTRSQGLQNEVTRLLVMYSPTGAINTGDCTSSTPDKSPQGVSAFGDFQTVLTINNPQSAGGYPQDWTQFTANINGSGRVAFLYFMDTGSPDFNAGTIAIDTITANTISASTPQNVPAISFYGFLMLVFLVLFWVYISDNKFGERIS